MGTEHYGITINEEADELVKAGTKGFPSDQTGGIPFVVGKAVIKSHLKQEHLNRWKTCKGCRQSKTLMSETLSSRTKELQAMSTEKLKVTVGLLTGHTALRACMFKPGFTLRQDCQLCGDKKEDSVCIVCYCLALACKRYRNLSCMLLHSKVLENMRVSSLIR